MEKKQYIIGKAWSHSPCTNTNRYEVDCVIGWVSSQNVLST